MQNEKIYNALSYIKEEARKEKVVRVGNRIFYPRPRRFAFSCKDCLFDWSFISREEATRRQCPMCGEYKYAEVWEPLDETTES